MLGIDAVDDLQMARQDALEQMHRPGFQRLGQECVVGVGERAHGDFPGIAPRQAVHVDEQPHQFGNRDARMRVVELDRRPQRQEMEVAIGAQVTRHEVLQRRGHKQIFLPQPQLPAGWRVVARIKDLRDRFRARLLDQRADVIAAIEHIEPQRVGRARGPQTQRIDVAATPTDDRCVVSDRLDGLVRPPDIARDTMRVADGFDPSAEVNVVDDLGPRELPGIAERQPVLRIFLLPAVLDDLAKQSVIVADAVAVGRDAETRHALHEAGGKPAESAVAERRIGFGGSQPIGIDAEVAERGACDFGETEVAQDVGQQPADEKFEGEIVDSLAALRLAGALGGKPAMNDTVADRMCRRDEPIAIGRRCRILADLQRELGKHGALEFGQFLIARDIVR